MNAALDLLSALVIEDGRRWGHVAHPFQWADARAVLDPDAAPYNFLTRSRGGSKTADLAGMAIAVMLAQLPAGSRLYGVAADRDQGRLLLDSIQGFATRTPELRDALRIESYRVIATRSGSVLDVLAADAASAWGLRPAFVVADELAQWPATSGARRLFEAITSAAAKVHGSRMVLLTTAGDPSHWSRKMLDHATGDPLWRVNEVTGPAPWLEPQKLEEQRRRLPESSYRRLFLNEWTAAEDRLVDEDDLRACVTLDGPVPPRYGERYVIGLDVGLKRDRTVAAVAHAEPVVHTPMGEVSTVTVGARVLLDRMQVWEGTRLNPVRLSDVEEWLAEAARTYHGATVVFDPFQAIGTMQRIAARGVPTIEFTFTAQSVGKIAVTLHRLLRDQLLALPDDEALLEELANVRLRETTPGVYRLDHDADRHDDRAVALALAAHHLLEHGHVTFDPRGASVGWTPAEFTPAYTGWEPPGYDEPL